MKTLKDYLGTWEYRNPRTGQRKIWTLFPLSPSIDEGDKEYVIKWYTSPIQGATVDRVIKVNAVEALARALAHERGGYLLTTRPLTQETFPASASLTIDQMKATRKRLAKAKQRKDNFTWEDWLSGKDYDWSQNNS